MAKPRPNQEGFNRRLEAVQGILRQYGLKSTRVTPLAYVAHCPFMFNNYIFQVELAAPATRATFPGRQACTAPPPDAGVSTLVVRMSNPRAEGLNNANRVENDVAASWLIRQSVARAGLDPVVPVVYAWAPYRVGAAALATAATAVAAEEGEKGEKTDKEEEDERETETGFGWTIAEFKPGADLDAQFPTLAPDAAAAVLEQLAELLVAVQRAELPAAARFGGLTIDARGRIVSGQMPLLKGGPWDTYADLWVARLEDRLAEADQSTLLQGWRESGPRDRIEAYIAAGGVQAMLEPVDTDAKGLIHGDLTLNNILYDAATQRITGLLDFDWAAVTHPCDEFLSGLWDVGGGLDERIGPLRAHVLSGDFSHPPDGLGAHLGGDAEARRQWRTAKAWDAALARRAGAVRPSAVAGVGRIRALRDLEALLCPFALSSAVVLGRTTDNDRAAERAETEAAITAWLDRWKTTEVGGQGSGLASL